DGLLRVRQIVEKPGKDAAPSNLASVNGYLLTPDILPYLERNRQSHDGNGELMIKPVMQEMVNDGHTFYAKQIQNGTYFDTGDKLEYLKTVIDFGARHDELGPELIRYMHENIERWS